MNGWDITLIVAVSIMGTAVAFVRDPENKALVLMLPVPFTLASLALGRPLDATNVLAMGLLFIFTIGVWFLHARWRWSILPAIAVSAVGYCATGAGIARLQPTSNLAFWLASTIIFLVALTLIQILPYHHEPHHRTPLPIWIKLPTIVLVITGVVAIKQHLGGFMTMFPMVGVVAAYEARNSLWTIVRRIPWIVLIMTPIMVFIRLALLWLLRSRYHDSGSRRPQPGLEPGDNLNVFQSGSGGSDNSNFSIRKINKSNNTI